MGLHVIPRVPACSYGIPRGPTMASLVFSAGIPQDPAGFPSMELPTKINTGLQGSSYGVPVEDATTVEDTTTSIEIP